MELLDRISDRLSSRYVEYHLVGPGDFELGSFTHISITMGLLYTPSIYPTSGDYSAFMALPQQFSDLEEILIHTPELYGDNPTPRVTRTAPPIRGFLTFLSFVLHLADLDLRFSSILISSRGISSGFPLNDRLEACSPTLCSLEFEYITLCGDLYFHSSRRTD